MPEERQRWYAIKIFERDERVIKKLKISKEKLDHIEKDISAAERELDDDSILFTSSKYDALDDADALILITEWKEFRSLDLYELSKRLKSKIIFDGRNIYPKRIQNEGFELYQIGC